MKRLLLTVLAAAGLSAGIAGLALAKTKSYDDPKKDNKCCGKSFDFIEASAAKGGGGLKHTVKIKGKALADSPPILNIDTGGSKACEFYVGVSAGKALVVNCDTGEEAPAEVSASGKSFKFTFGADAIGNPGKYRWQFVYSGEYEGGAIDKAPNKPKSFSP